MAYIGPAPKLGQNREVDDISSGFNGSTTAFTLQVGGSNASPGSANSIIVSVNNVIQNPNTDYTINGSTITFTSAPTNGQAFFAVILNQGVDTSSPADGSVTTAKLGDDAVTAAKLANTSVTAGSYTTADLTVDAQGRITAASNGNISSAEIADNAVTTAKINDDAVTQAKIAAGAITNTEIDSSAGITGGKLANNTIGAAQIAAGAITNTEIDSSAAIAGSKLADSGITTAKIADDAITSAKLASSSVGADALGSEVVGTANIAANAITSAKIVNGGVGTDDLADDAVTSAKLASSSVGTDALGSQVVVAANIASNAVETAKINNGAVTAAKLASGVGGKILQVVQGTLDGTFSSTSESFVNIGLSAAITPASSSNKVLVIAMLNFGSDNNGNRLIIRLVRTGDDNILSGTGSGSRTRASAQYATTDDGDMNNVNLTHLDSPSTTSSTTYQVQCKVQSSSGTIKFGASGGDGNSSIEARTPQRIVLLEVSA